MKICWKKRGKMIGETKFTGIIKQNIISKHQF